MTRMKESLYTTALALPTSKVVSWIAAAEMRDVEPGEQAAQIPEDGEDESPRRTARVFEPATFHTTQT